MRTALFSISCCWSSITAAADCTIFRQAHLLSSLKTPVLMSGVDISVEHGWEAAYPPNVCPRRHPRIASTNFVARGTLSSASAAAARVLTKRFLGAEPAEEVLLEVGVLIDDAAYVCSAVLCITVRKCF